MIKPFEIAVTDIEGDGLYDTITQVHCATIRCCLTGDSVDFLSNQMDAYCDMLHRVKLLIGHNVLDYDGPALDKVEVYKYNPQDWFDTLVFSRLIYPDLLGGHGLDAWGKRLGVHKIDWRAECVERGYIAPNAPQGEEFRLFRPEMVGYCNQDCHVNHRLLERLMKYAKWDWNTLLELQEARLEWSTEQQQSGVSVVI